MLNKGGKGKKQFLLISILVIILIFLVYLTKVFYGYKTSLERKVNFGKKENLINSKQDRVNRYDLGSMERIILPTGKVVKSKIILHKKRKVDVQYDEKIGTPSSKFLEKFVK